MTESNPLVRLVKGAESCLKIGSVIAVASILTAAVAQVAARHFGFGSVAKTVVTALPAGVGIVAGCACVVSAAILGTFVYMVTKALARQ